MDDMSQDDFDAEAALLTLTELMNNRVIVTPENPDAPSFYGRLIDICMADSDNSKEGLVYTIDNSEFQFQVKVTSLRYDIRPA